MEISGNLPKLSYEDFAMKVAQLRGFDLRGVIFVGRNEWIAKPDGQKGPIWRMFMNILKRMTGRCFRCGKNYSNTKIVTLCGMEAHHIVESKRGCEPTKLAKQEYSYMENGLKKCISLCRACHQIVTTILKNMIFN